MKSDASCNKVLLLIYWERGYMYQQLKARYSGQWVQICRDELNVCSQTANRYISFFELVGFYPRIIICELSFETIMYCKEAIIEQLEKDEQLGIRMKVPLRGINIHANMDIEGDILPAAGDYTTEEEQYNWDAGWQLSDKIIEDTLAV